MAIGLGAVIAALTGGTLNGVRLTNNNPRQSFTPDLSGLTSEQRDAYGALWNLFGSFGLSSLAHKIHDYVVQGYDANTITILLQQTPEYKQRFAANETRKKEGLPVLSPKEYLATEKSYKQILRQAGLPEGFYDTQDDFTEFIVKDVSPSELQGRVDLAIRATQSANPYVKEALRNRGLGQSEITAYFLDPDKALPFIQRTVQTAEVSAEALRQDLVGAYAARWAGMGITAEQAREGYSAIAEFLPQAQKLTEIYGGYGTGPLRSERYTEAIAELDVFGQDAEARKQRRRLASQERAQFGGAAGAARGGLSSGTRGQV